MCANVASLPQGHSWRHGSVFRFAPAIASPPIQCGSSNAVVTEANPALGRTPRAAEGPASADGPVPPDVAYQLIHDELLLDGSARLNLATFVTTWMEPQARVLMAECVDKNMIDKDEYPATAELERRCVAMLADLWHAPVGRPTRPAARPPDRARPACSPGWR